MKLHNFLSVIMLILTVSGLSAALPEGYYDSLEGKAGPSLRRAISELSEGHKEVTYGNKTWDAFISTDVFTVNGRKVWYDMYSNNLVYLPGHDALNIEHTVANSWWGKTKNAAYCDLFHLNPSDQVANGKKSNYPPGKVASATQFDNGILLVGAPADGQGGGAPYVFEPADEYKGDFARAFLYIFTVYPEIGWLTDYAYMFDIAGDQPVLKDWAINLLLDWDRRDPVDSREKARNDAIYILQGNRNPFIDLKDAAHMCYGAGGDMVMAIEENPTIDRPGAPEFHTARMTGRNTYTGRYWADTLFPISGPGQLWISYDGMPYDLYDGAIEIPAALSDGQTHSIKAYMVDDNIRNKESEPLRSAVTSLDVRACDPGIKDWSLARWSGVTSPAEVDTDNYFIILSGNTLHAMSSDGGVDTKFMRSAGFVDFCTDSIHVIELPVDAAIVRFGMSGSDSHPRTLAIYDTRGDFKGYWNTAGKNSMKLDKSKATPGRLSVNENNDFNFEFAENGRLQFNKTQPRFLNYESNQGSVKLYKFLDFDEESGIIAAPGAIPQPVVVDGHDILAPEGSIIFDLGGRRVSGRGLTGGIYIVTIPGNGGVKVMVP